jgi:hypothetical protein
MKKMLILVMAAALLVGLVGAGYAAFFTDMGTAEANSFTAGDIDLKIDGMDNKATATWESGNWAPGDSQTHDLHLTNEGSIDASHIYIGCENPNNTDPDGDGSNLMEAIAVEIYENPGDGWHGPFSTSLDVDIGDEDGILTLAEFCGWQTGQIGYYAGTPSNPFGIVAGTGSYDFRMQLSFIDQGSNAWNWGSADDIYQNDSCSFELTFQLSQNSPTDGIYSISRD